MTTADAQRQHVGPASPRWAPQGIRLIRPDDDEWPDELLAVPDTAPASKGDATPHALWARGTATLNEALARSVTIVGTSQASEYGRQVAGEFAAALAANGVTVVSGAASGVGACAHRACLDAGGVTVAVVGYGLGVDPPAGTVDLLHRISERGLVVSAFPLNAQATKWRYLARSRLLAALSQGTVLVEAALRSGAHQTATKAAALGRPVMALPGQITTPTATACHAMLRAGTATLVTSAAEIAETIGRWGKFSTPQPTAPPSASVPRRPDPPLTGQALQVHQTLGARDGKSTEQVADEAGLPLLRVRAVLTELELDGITERCESGWRRAA